MDSRELTDGTVMLSPLGLADIDAHLAGEDEELARWLNGGPGTRATVEAHVRRCIAQWEADGPVHAFGIRVGAPAELTGTVEVQFDQPYLTPGQVNISYGLYPAWRGRGLATRAVELACQHAAAYGAVGAVIKADPGNPASAAVARRVGFVPVRRGADEDGSVMDWFGRELSIRRKPNRQHSPTTLKSQT